MDKLRKIFAVAMICLVVSSIAVYALSISWTHYINWAVGEVTTFDVFHNELLTQPWLPTENTTALTEEYWINNTGNVKLRVTASGIILSGIASVTWDPATPIIDIPVGAKGNMTIRITQTTATGTCQVSFTCVKAT
jgi:hypothetical protein